MFKNKLNHKIVTNNISSDKQQQILKADSDKTTNNYPNTQTTANKQTIIKLENGILLTTKITTIYD